MNNLPGETSASPHRTHRAPHEKLSGYDHTYFSGAGLDLEMNGPWDNTRIRIETGYPVVAQGVKGLTLNFNFLKVF